MKSDFKISYPGSQKVYLNGNIHPSVKVGMRMVTQLPTVSIKDGERIETPNPSIYIYDTSGPYGDNNTIINLNNIQVLSFATMLSARLDTSSVGKTNSTSASTPNVR